MHPTGLHALITNAWKQILIRWYERSPTVALDYLDVWQVAKEVGLETNLHSIRDRVRKYRDRLVLLRMQAAANIVSSKPLTSNSDREIRRLTWRLRFHP
jgi:hypothetical protein